MEGFLMTDGGGETGGGELNFVTGERGGGLGLLFVLGVVETGLVVLRGGVVETGLIVLRGGEVEAALMGWNQAGGEPCLGWPG